MWNDASRERATSAEGVDEDGSRVDGVVDGLADEGVGQRTVRGVDRDVVEDERRRALQRGLLLIRLFPVGCLTLGDGDDVDVAALELGDGGAGFGYDPCSERFGRGDA